jgi:hypothetical protein
MPRVHCALERVTLAPEMIVFFEVLMFRRFADVG